MPSGPRDSAARPPAAPSSRSGSPASSSSGCTRAGTVSLRIGTTDYLERFAGHIGYGVELPYRGRRYAARACKLLFELARKHGMTTLWITCNPENVASRRTCELIGGELVGIVDLPPDSDMYKEGERQKCRYRIRL